MRDSVARVAVPERRPDGRSTYVAGQDGVSDVADLFGINEAVCPVADRHRALRVWPHREARDPEEGRFLLESSPIRHEQACAANEGHEFHVPEGVDDLEAAARIKPAAASAVRPRGWRGSTTGISRASPLSISAVRWAASGVSTFEGRWMVEQRSPRRGRIARRTGAGSSGRGWRAACRSSGCRRSGCSHREALVRQVPHGLGAVTSSRSTAGPSVGG